MQKKDEPWKLRIEPAGDFFRWEVEGISSGLATSREHARKAAYDVIMRSVSRGVAKCVADTRKGSDDE